MKAAEKEVEQLEKEVREGSGFVSGPEHENESLPPIELPPFRVLQKQRHDAQRSKAEKERKALEEKVADIESQIRAAEARLKALNDDSTTAVRESSISNESNASRSNVSAAKEKEPSASDSAVIVSADHEESTGAIGPGGEFVEFPPYDGNEPPNEWKKAFTQYCNSTKKDLKASLPPEDRKNKVRRIDRYGDTPRNYFVVQLPHFSMF